jgi:hypothetical protein
LYAEYERLRSQALRGGASPELGAALLARQGLAAWLEAWTALPRVALCGEASAAVPGALPDPLRQELVLALATLVLRTRTEGRHVGKPCA